MATVFPAPPALQVGAYFVQQYYYVLENQPECVHQFYTDASTMIRVNGSENNTASGMLQIHSLIMSLNFTGVDIKSANSLESWNKGVIVMLSGSVLSKDYGGRRKFVQTFFLAPQEKGYFVLNDIFHFLDEEQLHQNQAAILSNHFDSKVNISNPLPEPASDYMPAGETQTRDFVVSAHVEENDSVDKYSLPEQQQQHYGLSEQQQQHYGLPEQQQQQQQHYGLPEQQQEHYSLPEQQQEHYSLPEQQHEHYSLPEQEQQYQIPESNNVLDEAHVEESTTSFSQDLSPVPAEEAVEEPQKHTYASILRVSKGHSTSSVAPQRSVKKSEPPTSEWHYAAQPTQQFHPATSTSMGFERSNAEGTEEVAPHDEEGEGRSVYVKNLSSTVTESDIEQEFKNFGTIKYEGVVVRNRKDIGVCYAFVEFEDASGAQNAIKASPIQLAGRQAYIEERRANSSSITRGRGRGRGRGGYQTTEASRGRFGGGRNFVRGNGDGYESRSRGNGYTRRGPSQDRGILGNHVTRNGDDAAY